MRTQNRNLGSPKPEAAGGGRTRGTMIVVVCLSVCSVFGVFISDIQIKDVMGTETPKQQHFVVEQTRQSVSTFFVLIGISIFVEFF